MHEVCNTDLRSQHDALDMGGVGQHGQHDIALLADLLIGGSLCAAGHNLVHSSLVEVADQQIGVTLLQNVLCHGLAHDTQTDQTDFHKTVPPYLIVDQYFQNPACCGFYSTGYSIPGNPSRNKEQNAESECCALCVLQKGSFLEKEYGIF